MGKGVVGMKQGQVKGCGGQAVKWKERGKGEKGVEEVSVVGTVGGEEAQAWSKKWLTLAKKHNCFPLLWL